MPEIKQEAESAKTAQSIKGASYVVTGDVTELVVRKLAISSCSGFSGAEVADCLRESQLEYCQCADV